MKRPYVICHMAATIDGRIIGEHWGVNLEKYSEAYEECHNSFESRAWMVGRVTMEKDFTERHPPAPVRPDKPISRTAFIGDKEASSFAIVVDAHGKIGWSENEIDGDHVIEVLSEAVSDDYLQYLQNIKVSYIFAGQDKINFHLALEELHQHFQIKTLMLEGGGHMNGSVLNADLIDEVSIACAPNRRRHSGHSYII
jgi:riboflavin biosynthesis pyrimidine reductase